MIQEEKGRGRSVQTREEQLEALSERLKDLTEEEQKALQMLIRQHAGAKPVAQSLATQFSDQIYHTQPVSLEEFVLDPYYLGTECAQIYPVLLEDLKELFAGQYTEVVMTGAIGVGKCTSKSTVIFDSYSGKRMVMGEVAGERLRVRSFAYDRGRKREWRDSEARVEKAGHKPVWTVRLKSGRCLRATPDHPVLTGSGWVRVDELKARVDWGSPGSLVAAPRKLEFPYQPKSVNHAEVRSLAYRIADGAGPEKVLPDEVFEWDQEAAALFVSRFWACEGRIALKNQGGVQLELTLASETMIDQFQDLFLRFGVHACKRYKREKGAWRLLISGRPNIGRFLEALRWDIPGQEEELKGVRKWLDQQVQRNTNTDVSPMDYEGLKCFRRDVGGIAEGAWDKIRIPSSQRMGRDKLREVFAAHGAPEWCAWWPDLYWDEVVAIERRDEREPVYDLEAPECGSFVADGVVVHNTFFCSIGLCRMIYELSCMHEPQRTLGLTPNSSIIFAGLSANEDLAKQVVLKNVVAKIATSQYFRDNFPFKITQKEVRFPKEVKVVARATTPTSALGLNVFGALVDEVNFMPQRKKAGDRHGKVDMAKVIYDTIKRRMFSRYGYRGKLFLPSSKATKDSFTGQRIAQARTDASIFTRDYALWDVKPQDFSDETFYVLCGNEQVQSAIVSEKEAEELKDNLPDRTVLIEVPDNVRPLFESDLEGSIRDVAGIATVAISPFIQRVVRVREMVDPTRKHPYSHETYDPSVPGSFCEAEMVKSAEIVDYEGKRRKARMPILNPRAPRFVHIDPALSACSAGFVMGHVSGQKAVSRSLGDLSADPHVITAPIFTVDLVLEIVPPPGGELDFGLYERLVLDLRRMGYPIRTVSADSWNSVATLQRLEKQGFSCCKVSLDRNWDPYQLLKQAIYEGRVRTYKYAPLLKELQGLEANWDKRKVVKPRNGSKDVADALAGAYFCAQEHKSVHAVMPVMGGGADYQRVADDNALFEALMMGGLVPAEQADLHQMRRDRDALKDAESDGFGIEGIPPIMVGGLSRGGGRDPWNS